MKNVASKLVLGPSKFSRIPPKKEIRGGQCADLTNFDKV